MAVTTIECPQCHHQNPDDAEFCEQCGAELPVPVATTASSSAATQVAGYAGQIQAQSPADELVCPKCKAPYVPGDVFCFNCGNDLRGLAGNQPAATIAQPVGATPALNAGAPVAPATNNANNNNGMSGDDWDNAFENPGTASASSAATSTVAPPTQATPPAQLDSQANGFAVPPPAAPASNPVQVGTPGPATQLTLNVTGPYGPQIVEYTGRELLLGRNDAKTRVFPDVNLDDSAASRRHASVWLDDADATFYVQDLESSNGTSLNGRDIEQGNPVKLSNGDVLKIGTRYSIQVHIS